MQQLILLHPLLWKEVTEVNSFTFSLPWALSLHKTGASAFCVCWGGNDKVPGVLTTTSIGGSSSPRSALCVHERMWRVNYVSSAKLLLLCGCGWGVWEREIFCNSTFLNKCSSLVRAVVCKFTCSSAVPNIQEIKMSKSDFYTLSSFSHVWLTERLLGSDEFNEKNCRQDNWDTLLNIIWNFGKLNEN